MSILLSLVRRSVLSTIKREPVDPLLSPFLSQRISSTRKLSTFRCPPASKVIALKIISPAHASSTRTITHTNTIARSYLTALRIIQYSCVSGFHCDYSYLGLLRITVRALSYNASTLLPSLVKFPFYSCRSSRSNFNPFCGICSRSCDEFFGHAPFPLFFASARLGKIGETLLFHHRRLPPPFPCGFHSPSFCPYRERSR